jgi:hypothetical protein
MCWENLIVTILLWICIFNLVEKAVGCLEAKIDQVMVYVGILIGLIVYISASHDIQVCELM